ncbi:MAG: hypothetical protein B7733_12955 [Myxococcales bacterium FL481]|nr:MAG: hypothetical protein B7733_12955 [Myxococcales bacterium FL481]
MRIVHIDGYQQFAQRYQRRGISGVNDYLIDAQIERRIGNTDAAYWDGWYGRPQSDSYTASQRRWYELGRRAKRGAA